MVQINGHTFAYDAYLGALYHYEGRGGDVIVPAALGKRPAPDQAASVGEELLFCVERAWPPEVLREYDRLGRCPIDRESLSMLPDPLGMPGMIELVHRQERRDAVSEMWLRCPLDDFLFALEYTACWSSLEPASGPDGWADILNRVERPRVLCNVLYQMFERYSVSRYRTLQKSERGDVLRNLQLDQLIKTREHMGLYYSSPNALWNGLPP